MGFLKKKDIEQIDVKEPLESKEKNEDKAQLVIDSVERQLLYAACLELREIKQILIDISKQ